MKKSRFLRVSMPFRSCGDYVALRCVYRIDYVLKTSGLCARHIDGGGKTGTQDEIISILRA